MKHTKPAVLRLIRHYREERIDQRQLNIRPIIGYWVDAPGSASRTGIGHLCRMFREKGNDFGLVNFLPRSGYRCKHCKLRPSKKEKMILLLLRRISV
jgi:hypothetical protein